MGRLWRSSLSDTIRGMLVETFSVILPTHDYLYEDFPGTSGAIDFSRESSSRNVEAVHRQKSTLTKHVGNGMNETWLLVFFFFPYVRIVWPQYDYHVFLAMRFSYSQLWALPHHLRVQHIITRLHSWQDESLSPHACAPPCQGMPLL